MKRSTTGGLLWACLVLVLVLVGCSPGPAPSLVRRPAGPPERPPAVNLPVSLRQTNWLYRGEGSCAVASSISLCRWHNRPDAAARLRRNFGGGQTPTMIRRAIESTGLRTAETRTGDPTFLDWCSRTRRGAIIWWLPGHCCTFCGWVRHENGDTYGIILDNNRVRSPMAVPRAKLLSDWRRRYSGFALTIVGTSPLPPPLTPGLAQCDRSPNFRSSPLPLRLAYRSDVLPPSRPAGIAPMVVAPMVVAPPIATNADPTFWTAACHAGLVADRAVVANADVVIGDPISMTHASMNPKSVLPIRSPSTPVPPRSSAGHVKRSGSPGPDRAADVASRPSATGGTKSKRTPAIRRCFYAANVGPPRRRRNAVDFCVSTYKKTASRIRPAVNV